MNSTVLRPVDSTAWRRDIRRPAAGVVGPPRRLAAGGRGGSAGSTGAARAAPPLPNVLGLLGHHPELAAAWLTYNSLLL
ncbi:hypothetical protein, partial [Nocardia abscessus]|uniref:hypothetical protein n=1 Tax=Nocardia abscessus TaxID=120957 RepID=UPI003CC7E1FB